MGASSSAFCSSLSAFPEIFELAIGCIFECSRDIGIAVSSSALCGFDSGTGTAMEAEGGDIIRRVLRGYAGGFRLDCRIALGGILRGLSALEELD